jgi:gliding motility-associated-like protein
MNKNLLLKVAILLLPMRIFSQSPLSVSSNSVATQLAQTITGTGVTVSNASLSCGSRGAGTFTYPSTGTQLGLTAGIILTTGHATDAANPAQIVSVSQSNTHTFSDPDLTAIETTAKYDNCILEFNFVPICNQISITYVFGSSEYYGYQCSVFNDVFGIFLTGANPGGGTYSGTNIAALPNGIPVSINNVNNGSDACNGVAHNSTYYVDNSAGTDIVYEGLTTAITSVKPVVPCSTYFMKIAIADAVDKIYDSGVFIGGNAVSCSTGPSASITSTPVSGCNSSDGTASVTISNYTATPTYSWSPGGQTTSSLSGLPVGTYTCVVGFQTACSGVYNQTVTTTVGRPATFTLSTSTSPATCSGNANGSATVSISGGTPPYTTSWSTTPVQTTTVINNLLPGTYSVSVKDNSGCLQTAAVHVVAVNPTTLQFSTMQVCGNHAVLSAPAGTSYQWYDTSNVIISGANTSTYSATAVNDGQSYIVSYIDNTTHCKDSLEIDILEYSVTYNVVTSPACNGASIGALDISATGTHTFSAYDWILTGVSTQGATSVPSPITISNLAAGNYSITITQAGNPSCRSTYTANISSTTQAPITNTITACNLDTLRLNPSIIAGSTNHWYLSSQFLDSTAANISYTVAPHPLQVNGTLYTDTIKSSLGCISTIKMYIEIQSFTASSIVQQPKCYNDSVKATVLAPRETNGPIGKPYTFTWIYPIPYTSPAPINGGAFPASSTQVDLHAGTGGNLTYTCVVNAGNCAQKVTFTLINPAKLHTDSIYAYYCPKDSLALLVADSGRTNYVWHPSNFGASVTGDSIHVPVQNINNCYVTYLNNGCLDTGKIIIMVATYDAFRPDELVNVFSPNGDKRNDFFYPFYSTTLNQYQIFKQSDTYELTVYDRWGKLVYSATDYNKPWDGKTKSGHDADNGTYFYVIKYKSNCGSKAGLEEKKGFVELIR